MAAPEHVFAAQPLVRRVSVAAYWVFLALAITIYFRL